MDENYFDRYDHLRDQPAPEAEQEDSFLEDAGDVAIDIAKGAFNGVMEFGDSVATLEADALNAGISGFEQLTGRETNFRLKRPAELPPNFRAPRFQELQTPGKITEGVTQFGIGYATGSNLLRVAGWAHKGKPIFDWTRAMASGMIADFISFTEEEERLSNLVQEFPSLRNPVTEYLAADSDDHWAEGRLKNVLEGAGLGLAADIIISSVRGLKNARVLKEAGDEEGAIKIIAEAKDEAARILNKTEIPASDLPTPELRFSEPEITEIARRIKSGKGDLDAISDAFNIGKWKSTQSGKKALNAFVEKLQATDPESFTSTQTLNDTRKLAKDLLMNEADLRMIIASQVKSAEEFPAAVIALKIRTATAADQLPKLASHYIALKESGEEGTEEALERAMMAFNFLADDVTNLKTLQKSAARATSAGRINANSRVPNQNSVTPEQAISFMTDLGGDTDAFMQNIAKLHGKPSAIRRIMAQVAENRTLDIANEVWINSILSGPWTHLVNMTSAGIETALRPLENSFAAALRGDRSGIRAELQIYTGMVHAFTDSFKMAKESFLTERNILDPIHAVNELNPHRVIRAGDGTFTNPDQSTVQNGINLVGQVLRGPSRFLASEDEFFKQINYRSKLYSDGYLQGLEQGLKGNDLKEFALSRVEAGFDVKTGAALNDRALRFAQESTFTENLEYGLGASVQGAVIKNPALRQILPFVRTPTNLIRHTIRRTPLFFMDQKAMADIMGQNGPKAQSEQMTKLAVGHSMIGMAALMSANGMIEGRAPSDPDLRRQFFDSGRKEYAFKGPDGQYYAFNRLDPRFAIFGIVADITKNIEALSEEDQAYAAFLPTAALSFTNNMASKSYLKGLSETLEVMMSDDPEEWGRYFRWQLGSRVVPFSSALRTLNPDNEAKELRSVADGILANIPGLSQNVEAKRNVLGEKIEIGNPFISSLDPSPVKQELAALGEEFQLPAKTIPQTRVNMTRYKNKNGQTSFDRYQELAGTIQINGQTMETKLEALVNSPNYQRLPSFAGSELDGRRSQRGKAITQIIQRYRNAALRQVRREYPDLDHDIRVSRQNLVRAQRRGPESLQPLLQSQ